MTETDFKKYNYLVIDDDDFSQEVVGSVLTRLGASKIFFAGDGEAAKRLAQRHRPDFILLDLYMPDIDGWALLGQLRRLVPQTVIVMVTGSHQPSDFNKSMDQNVDGFCLKPVMPDIMRKTLIKAWQRRH